MLKRWLGGEGESVSEHPMPNATEAEVDLVDQAEVFQTLRVSDVMTPRADIAALEISMPMAEVVRQFVEVEHSRMPIYRETLDDPVGVVHIKDLLKLIAPGDVDLEHAPTPAVARAGAAPAAARRALCAGVDAHRRPAAQDAGGSASTWPWSSTSSAAPTAW